jgi:hypothetical protein
LVITTSNGKNLLNIPRADTARFTADSKYAVVPDQALFIRMCARLRSKRKNNPNFRRIRWVLLPWVKTLTKIPAIRSFKIADKASVVAYLSPADTVKKPEASDTSKKAIATTIAPPVKDGAELNGKPIIKRQNPQL